MTLSLLLLVLALAGCGRGVDPSPPNDLSRFASHTKMELVRTLLGPRPSKKDVAAFTLTEEDQIRVNGTGPREPGTLFRRKEDVFLVRGARVLRIRKEGHPSRGHALETVARHEIEEDAIFFEHFEWKDLSFLVACYDRAYCSVLSSKPFASFTYHQRIGTRTVPADAEFFVAEDGLFLLLATDPCRVYRWTGGYFDEHEQLQTEAATAVAAFRDGAGATVLVVGQNSPARKVYSKVFVRRNGKTELTQLLETSNALRAVPFVVDAGGEMLRFVFVLNERFSSGVFWWNGREFSPWKKLDGVVGPGLVRVASVSSEPFVFIARPKGLSVYHPTATTFDLVRTLVLDREIAALDLREEPGSSPALILLTRSDAEPSLGIVVLAIDVSYLPESENRKEVTDPVLRCLTDLKRRLEERNRKLDESASLSRELSKLRGSIELEALTVPAVELKNFRVSELRVEPPGETLEATPSEIQRDLDDLRDKAKALLARIKSASKEAAYRIHGDVRIGRMKASHIRAGRFGERSFDLGNIVSVTRNQTLSGEIRLTTLSAATLSAPSINGVHPRNLLRRSGPVQEVTGEYSVRSVRARSVVFGRLGRLNGTVFSRSKASTAGEGSVLRGKKTFPRMRVKRLEVENVNDMPAEDWISTVPPYSHAPDRGEALEFDRLRVENLTVTNVNGLPWREYLDELRRNRTGRRVRNAFAVRLEAETINGIPTESFLTTDAAQNVSSAIWVRSVTADADPRRPDQSSRAAGEASSPKSPEEAVREMAASRLILHGPVILSGRRFDPDRLRDAFWTRSFPQTIEGSVTMGGRVTAGALVVGTVNGRGLDDFATVDAATASKSRLEFAAAQVNGDVVVGESSARNVDLRLLSRTAAKVTGENRVTGRKTFLGTVRARNLVVDRVAGTDVDAGVLRGASLVEVVGNATVRNETRLKNLNGRDFDEVVAKASERGRSSHLTAEELGAESAKTTEAFVGGRRGRLRILVRGNLRVPAIEATLVNGISIAEYLAQVVLKNESSTQNIRGRKHFLGPVKVRGNLDGVLNGRDLRELEATALSRSRPQNLTGAFVVDVLHADAVESEEVAGVAVDLLLSQENPEMQVIESDVVFENLAVAGNLQAANFVGGCDLSQVANVDLDRVRKIVDLDVKGNVTWRKDADERGSVSYLYANAVTKDEEQVIPGSVVFAGGVTVRNLTTKKNIDDVDLEFIVQDAVYRSLPVQEILQDVTFKGKLVAENVRVEENAIVDRVNGLDVLDFDQRLVRNGADAEVRGKKTFASGFVAHHLNADSVNGAPTSGIVFCDGTDEAETLRLPPTTFASVRTVNDANVAWVNDVDLGALLRDRMSRSRDQNITGSVTFRGGLVVKGNADLSRINDVRVEDLVSAADEGRNQTITGPISFVGGLSLPERLSLETLNGVNVTQAYASALLRDRDQVIEGNVEFTGDLESNGGIDLASDVNGCNVSGIRPATLQRDIGVAELSLSRAVSDEMDKMANAFRALLKPLVLTGLEPRAAFALGLSSVQTVRAVGAGAVLEAVGLVPGGGCDLPPDCDCPALTRVLPSANASSAVVRPAVPRLFARREEALGISVEVSSSNVSHGGRCRLEDAASERTSLSWTDGLGARGNVTVDGPGYLRDAEFFRMGDALYVVLAFYVQPTENRTSRLDLKVYEVRRGARQVQEIEGDGAQEFRVFWTPRGVVLVTGNGYDSEIFTDSVDSAIYRFSNADSKFELLRTVNTHGILSIASVLDRMDSFIFLVQKQTWPSLVLRYNHEYDNYYFSQKLDIVQSRVKSNFLSAAAFTTARPGYSGDVYLGLVRSDDSFCLFRNKHIEGFVEQLCQEQQNVRLLTPFWIGSRQYLAASSAASESVVYELVQQGYMD